MGAASIWCCCCPLLALNPRTEWFAGTSVLGSALSRVGVNISHHSLICSFSAHTNTRQEREWEQYGLCVSRGNPSSSRFPLKCVNNIGLEWLLPMLGSKCYRFGICDFEYIDVPMNSFVCDYNDCFYAWINSGQRLCARPVRLISIVF